MLPAGDSLVYEVARTGAMGMRIAFIHPSVEPGLSMKPVGPQRDGLSGTGDPVAGRA
jgi:hypothetical protein